MIRLKGDCIFVVVAKKNWEKLGEN